MGECVCACMGGGWMCVCVREVCMSCVCGEGGSGWVDGCVCERSVHVVCVCVWEWMCVWEECVLCV